jgi:pseudouridine-5'-phosphate glycosidase/pseudouridine kinase
LDASGIKKLPSRIPGTNVVNRTAQYIATNDTNKDLVMAMADMSILSGPLPRLPPSKTQLGGKWTVVDANWSCSRIRGNMKHSYGSRVAFEPVSVAKSTQLFQPDKSEATGTERYKVTVDVFPKHIIDLATPNQYELAAMHTAAKEHEFYESDRWWQIIDSLGIPSSGARDRFVSLTTAAMTDEGIPLQTIQLLPFIPTILTKLGADGVLMTKLLRPNDWRLTDPSTAPYILSRTSNGSPEVGGVYMRLFPAIEKVEDVVSVNGVGDTFLGVLIAGLAKGLKLDERLINAAQKGAVMTLRSAEAVSPQLGGLTSLLSAIRDEDLMGGPDSARLQIDF